MLRKFPFYSVLEYTNMYRLNLINRVVRNNIYKGIGVLMSSVNNKIENFGILLNVLAQVGINFVNQRRIFHPVTVPKINAFNVSLCPY